jgi:hypothetical protein
MASTSILLSLGPTFKYQPAERMPLLRFFLLSVMLSGNLKMGNYRLLPYPFTSSFTHHPPLRLYTGINDSVRNSRLVNKYYIN